MPEIGSGMVCEALMGGSGVSKFRSVGLVSRRGRAFVAEGLVLGRGAGTEKVSMILRKDKSL